MSDPFEVLTKLGQLGWAIGISFSTHTWLCSIGPRTIGSVTFGMFEDVVMGQHPTDMMAAIRDALRAHAMKHPGTLL